MTCRELVELCSDYLEGALDARQRAAFERHLAVCDSCAAYLEQMRMTIMLAGRLREDDLDPPVRDRLLAAFRGYPGIS
ncbi:MAG TPA: zf-HC2 domain-containing protein [Gaiellales bacterium]|jgi:anti-sigma factor RsiW|nr:zf-HC2 domain-containing protein [Gaiellales bacterium]